MRKKCVNCINNLTKFTHILCVFTQNLRRIYAEFTHMILANFIYACYGLRIYACFMIYAFYAYLRMFHLHINHSSLNCFFLADCVNFRTIRISGWEGERVSEGVGPGSGDGGDGGGGGGEREGGRERGGERE